MFKKYEWFDVPKKALEHCMKKEQIEFLELSSKVDYLNFQIKELRDILVIMAIVIFLLFLVVLLIIFGGFGK